ncbi:MAG: hypothetical protein WC943_06045 [Elusimicrobiota bacterium]|jgi:hypothetical protein
MGRPFLPGASLLVAGMLAAAQVSGAEGRGEALQEVSRAASSLSQPASAMQSARLAAAAGRLARMLAAPQAPAEKEAGLEAAALESAASSGLLGRTAAEKSAARILCLLASGGACGEGLSSSEGTAIPQPLPGVVLPDMKRVRNMEQSLGWDRKSAEGFGGPSNQVTAVNAAGAGRPPAGQPKAGSAAMAPKAQLRQGFSPKAAPPPPIETSGGIVDDAVKYWDRVGSDPKTSEIGRAGAATARAVLEMFNLERYEKSTGRFFEQLYDPEASAWDAAKAGGTALKDAAITTASLLPTGAWTKIGEVTKLDVLGGHIAKAVRSLSKAKVPPPSAVTANAERVAQLNAKIAEGAPLTREESRFLTEATKGKSDVVFHATKSEVLEKEILKFADDGVTVAGGRVAATTEQFVYGSRRQITSLWRKFINGVAVPKDGLIVFQGEASKVFKAHEVRGVYSAMKRAAGQQTSLGGGDVIITKAVYDTATKTLTVTGARMVTEGERQFLLQSKGFAMTRFWGRRVLLDGGFTSAGAFIAVSAAEPRFLEYVFDAPASAPAKKR